MPRPPAYDAPNLPLPPLVRDIPPGANVARIEAADVVVLLPTASARVILFPVNIARERRSRDGAED